MKRVWFSALFALFLLPVMAEAGACDCPLLHIPSYEFKPEDGTSLSSVLIRQLRSLNASRHASISRSLSRTDRKPVWRPVVAGMIEAHSSTAHNDLPDQQKSAPRVEATAISFLSTCDVDHCQRTQVELAQLKRTHRNPMDNASAQAVAVFHSGDGSQLKGLDV